MTNPTDTTVPATGKKTSISSVTDAANMGALDAAIATGKPTGLAPPGIPVDPAAPVDPNALPVDPVAPVDPAAPIDPAAAPAPPVEGKKVKSPKGGKKAPATDMPKN